MRNPLLSWTKRIVGFTLVTAALVAVAYRTIPPEKFGPDFICYWTAASLMVEGRNQYDVESQIAIQTSLGWDKQAHGLGVYDFLPNYYPPWMALLVIPLLPLGYGLAKITWLVLLAEMLVLSGLLLKDTIRGISAPVAVAVIVTFAFSIKVVGLGQWAPVVLLLVALAWKLLDQHRDVAAGCALAVATVKPQLVLLLLLALLGWTARHGRWGFWRGFAGTIAVLCAVSTLSHPAWLPSMLMATRVTPLPHTHYPGLGAGWYVALEAVGLHGVLLYAAYSALAVPVLLSLVRMTLHGERKLEDIFGFALIAPVFVIPYTRPYDFPLLLIPALIVMGSRMTALSQAMMAFALAVLPALHLLRLTADYVPPVVGVRRPEFTYVWIPLLIGATWLFCVGNRSTQETLDESKDHD